MIARIIWLAGLACAAAITAQLQLDRQSLRDRETAALVAAPFRANAQFDVARKALYGDDPQLALAEARRLIHRRPMPAEHLTLLAQAYAKAGDARMATLAIEAAALRGWRDPLAQEAMARLALNAGNLPEATRRFTALMVSNEADDRLLSELAAPLFADPESPSFDTFGEIIAGTDRWPSLFLRRGPDVLPPSAFAKIILDATDRGVVFDCDRLGRSQQVITQRDGQAGATIATAMPAHCRRD